MFIPPYFEDPTTLHVGCEPDRAYFIPASRPMDTTLDRREDSDRFRLLSGDWQFRYYPSIHDLDAEVAAAQSVFEPAFMDVAFNPDDTYDTIPVPSTWQMHGYDHHQYTNIRYPFPFDPPFVPHDNPCAVYRRTFDYEADPAAPRVLLDFEGVDSCFYVWVNGELAGYSQVSHSTSEFDITDLVEDGENTLVVLVLKWCDGSYLEDQDKLRMSGIFRDVYLLLRPERAFRDYAVTDAVDFTDPADPGARIDVDFAAGDRGLPDAIAVSILDADGSIVARADAAADGSAHTARAHLAIDHVQLWNPERPYCYRLVIETPDEAVTSLLTVSDLRVTAPDGVHQVIELNRRPITIHGMNRHDADPRTGYAIGVEQFREDLLLMKQHNVNGVRTSHYPNAPHFYDLFEQLGFLVIDEADIEAHGACDVYHRRADDWARNQALWNEKIADSEMFADAIVDRVRRCVERDKNHGCVLFWSMGNESAYGIGFERALDWVKQTDGKRLTHYESARYVDAHDRHEYGNLDVHSRMYPSIREIDDYFAHGGDIPAADHAAGENGRRDDGQVKPYVMCEFCHAMGNGPGDLEDYFQAIQRHPGLVGGYVWEWADHAVDAGRTAHGARRKYLYGGDFGDWLNDGNFCVDGMVSPGRTPHSGLDEFKNVFRPARVVAYADGRVTLRNHCDFLTLDELAVPMWELYEDGRLLAYRLCDDGETMRALAIEPHGEGEVPLPGLSEALATAGEGRVTVVLRMLTREAMWGMDPLFELGFDEVVVREGANQWVAQQHEEMVAGDERGASVHVSETSDAIVVEGTDWRYVLDRRTGLFRELNYRNHALLREPMTIDIWRAPTDNDRNIRVEWQRAQYDHATASARDLDVRAVASSTVSRTGADDSAEPSVTAVRIRCLLSVVAPSVQPIARADTTWTVHADGSLELAMDVERDTEFPFLPRFGIRMVCPERMRNVVYCGYGPNESYVDKHRSCWHGIFEGTPATLFEEEIRPQENGNHHDCDWASVAGDGVMLQVLRGDGDAFDFQALDVTAEAMTAAAHDWQLERGGATVVCVDWRQSGIGSNSCGPELLPQYRLDQPEFRLSVTLRPQ